MEHSAIRIGDRVRFALGAGTATGVVREDRGPIGVGCRRLFLIQYPIDAESPIYLELPAKDLELVTSQRDST
jgi:hypothetical protein